MNHQLLISISFLLNNAYAQCFSLANSKQCPQYSNQMISAYSTNFTDVASFDRYVQDLHIFDLPECARWPAAKGSPIKYAKSFACGYVVFAANNANTPAAFKCKNDVLPTNLCKSSINIALTDVQALMRTNCPNFAMWPAYNNYATASTDRNCLVSVGEDIPLKCGFANAADATNFCRNSTASVCCSAKSNTIQADGSSDPVASTTNAAAATTSSTQPTEATVKAPGSPATNPETSSGNPAGSGSSSSSNAQTSKDGSKSANSSSSSSSSESSTLSPMVIGIAAIGIALMAVIGSVLFIMFKRKPEDKEANGDAMSQNSYVPKPAPVETFGNEAPMVGGVVEEEMDVVFEYVASLFDELTLNVGDRVLVKEQFDDGWGIGLNKSTGQTGTFPLACIAPVGSVPPGGYRNSEYSEISKRTSSIYFDGPDGRSSGYASGAYGGNGYNGQGNNNNGYSPYGN
ncbi:hypothetical protein BC833DRAFT_594438 [Globomyces pollinis-pini]|nr:hypothetical protein BC833DRAFT_594438 [Globomyces pollinis-pini]